MTGCGMDVDDRLSHALPRLRRSTSSFPKVVEGAWPVHDVWRWQERNDLGLSWLDSARADDGWSRGNGRVDGRKASTTEMGREVNNYPAHSDSEGWLEVWRKNYRGRSKLFVITTIILCLPFCMIYWAAKQGEVAMDTFFERED